MINPAANHGFVELHVPDAVTAKKFYLLIGFQTVWDKGDYFVLKFDQTYLGFCAGPNFYFTDFPADTPRGFGTEIVIQVETKPIASYYRDISQFSELKIIEPLKKQPWGITDFRITDPFGYYLRFTEPEDIRYP